ncbi:MAG TPA: hypothetical protein VGL56_03900 [Fimbriimonadaceae bacterium]|jgi:hypothetical protein
MDDEDFTAYTPDYWYKRLPPYPRPTKGAPLALEPFLAGKILVKVAQGLHPRAAFAVGGISKYTYRRYIQQARLFNAGASNALPINSDQERISRYLYVFFELQSMALEIASVQYAEAQMRLLQGAPTTDISLKTVSKQRQQFRDGRIINLRDTTETKFQRYVRQPPKLPKMLFDMDDFEPGVESTS